MSRRIVLRRAEGMTVSASDDKVNNHMHVMVDYMTRLKAEVDETFAMRLRDFNSMVQAALDRLEKTNAAQLATALEELQKTQHSQAPVTQQELLVVHNRINYVHMIASDLERWVSDFQQEFKRLRDVGISYYNSQNPYSGFRGEMNPKFYEVPYDIKDRVGKGE